MLRNDIAKDVKKLLVDTGVTQAELAERVGTSHQYVNRMLNKNKDRLIGSGMLVGMVEALGYDVEIRYIPKYDYKEHVGE